jgi:hypothetical protein
MQYRQGDVFLERVPDGTVPRGAAPLPREGGRVVLAAGEATGHAHAIADPGAEVYRLGDEVEAWLRVVAAGGVALRHEEHAPIGLPPGTYRVRRQREYAPAATRQVAD